MIRTTCRLMAVKPLPGKENCAKLFPPINYELHIMWAQWKVLLWNTEQHISQRTSLLVLRVVGVFWFQRFFLAFVWSGPSTLEQKQQNPFLGRIRTWLWSLKWSRSQEAHDSSLRELVLSNLRSAAKQCPRYLICGRWGPAVMCVF